jgi:hypothetical protein
MAEERTGYAVIAQMLGVDVMVLRAVCQHWIEDENAPAIGIEKFGDALAEAEGIAARLNNTNLYEQAIIEAFDPADVPRTLPSGGVPRFVVHPGGKQEKD